MINFKNLKNRIERLQRGDALTYQHQVDAWCDAVGETRFSIGSARCIEDLLKAINEEAKSAGHT